MNLGCYIELRERVQLVVSQECSKLILADFNRRWGMSLREKGTLKKKQKKIKNRFWNDKVHIAGHDDYYLTLTSEFMIFISIFPENIEAGGGLGGKKGYRQNV